jgi:hypothetical protein
MAESGMRANAHNYNPATKDNSYGVFQINIFGSLANSRPAPEKLLDYKANINYAYQMWKTQGFNPWSVYKSGAYLKYM